MQLLMSRYVITYSIKGIEAGLTYFVDAKDEEDARKIFKRMNCRSEYRSRIKIINIKQIV